jgi:hypothetical protein
MLDLVCAANGETACSPERARQGFGSCGFGSLSRGQVRRYRRCGCDRRLLPYIQDSFFGTPTRGPVPCSGAEHPQCAGTFDAISAAIIWRFAPKWDLYFGAMFSQVNGGLAFGFLDRNNIDPTVGLRFRF